MISDSHQGKEDAMIQEKPRYAPHGLAALPVLLVVLVGSFGGMIAGGALPLPVVLIASIPVFMVTLICLGGFFMVAPNEGKVLQLFGSYVGIVKDPGLRWTNPFYSKRGISLRIRNFETEKLKVNDHTGNPIEIAAVVVWKVVDTAEAMFQVDNYEHF